MSKRSAVRATALILAFLVLFLSDDPSVSADTPSETADPAPNVIWMDEAQSEILFISESALNQVSLTKFSELVSLEQALRMRRQPGIYSEMFTGKQIPDCQQTDSAPSPQGSAAHPKELQDLILSSDRVFAGTIEALVPGWDAWRNNTAILAMIRVEEVFQAQTENDAVKPDARIGILFKGGVLTIEGVRLCHKIDKNFYHPEIGDRILVTALPCGPCEGITPCVPCESTFLKKRHVFPIVGSEVPPQPYPTLRKEARPTSLLDLRLESQGLVKRPMSGEGNPRSRTLPAPTLGGQIIWADEAKEHPVFLPQGVLQGASVDQLPLDRHVKSFLRNEIKLRKQFGSDCDEPPYSSAQGEAAKTFDFADLIVNSKASFIGRIVDIQGGLIVARRMVGEMAYIEVDEVLGGKDQRASPSEGQVVGVLFVGGVTIIDETIFCLERFSDFFRPAIGDEVLVGGAMSRNDPNYFHVGFVFPVVDGQVLAQPFAELSEDSVSISVKNLRGEIEEVLR